MSPEMINLNFGLRVRTYIVTLGFATKIANAFSIMGISRYTVLQSITKNYVLSTGAN